jgi:hypothetical protein
MERVEDYWKKHSGEVFILGNGTSLNDHDLSLLDPSKVITMNRSYKEVQKPLYHICCMDLTQIRKERWPQNILFLGGDEQSVGNSKLNHIPCPVILIQTKVPGNRIYPSKTTFEVHEELDLRRGFNITHAGLLAVHCAWWLGFEMAYLLGYDGYAGHYTKRDKTMIPNHKKHKQEMAEFMELLDGQMKVYNCNEHNAYEAHKYIPFELALAS